MLRRKNLRPGKRLTEESAQLFDKVVLEAMHGHRDLIDSLNAGERAAVLEWLSSAVVDGKVENSFWDTLWDVDYIRRPVSIETFLTDEYYLGKETANLHPLWMDDLKKVYAHNSRISEWIFCLSGETLVPLLDGTMKTLETLHREFTQAPEPVWVYSCDPTTGQVVPGECTKVTKFKEDQLYKITFEDGTTVRANADHEFLCRDGVKRRLRDLKVGDRLMPFFTRHQRQKGQRLHAGYEQVYLPGPKKYAYTHRVVGRMLAGVVDPNTWEGDRAVLHHIDLRCVNNSPRNLQWMGWGVHRALHASLPKSPECLKRLSAMGHARATDPGSPLRRGHLRFMRSREGRKLAAANLRRWVPAQGELRERAKRGSQVRWSDPQQHAAAAVRCGARSVGNTWGRLSSRVRRDVSVDALYAAYEKVGKLQNVYKALGVSRNAVVRILHEAGLTVSDLKRNHRNHVIRRIDLDAVEPVYCLTVPAWGNFAVVTDAGKRRGVFSGNTGAIGTGKSTIACAGMAYKLYLLSCLRNAPRYYGLLPGSLMVFGIYSLTKKQVNDTGYYKLKQFLDMSPFFKRDFPRDMLLDSKVVFKKTSLQVIPGSRSLHSMGLDLFSFLLDEVNFMKAKFDPETQQMSGQAYELYNSTHARLMSRYMRPGGTLPGMMFLVSSRGSKTAFLEERIKLASKLDSAHISDYALWETKPKHRFILPHFNVEVGDKLASSRLLGIGTTARPGAQVVDVPGEFRRAFEEDIDRALRDIAGVATYNLSPLIRDRESVQDAVKGWLTSPFTTDKVTANLNDNTQLSSFFNREKVCRIENSQWVPRLNPGAPRCIHVDLSLRRDCAGIAMSHLGGMRRVKRLTVDGTDAGGTESEVSAPYVFTDFMLRIVPPVGSEIDLSKIRGFIVFLSTIYNVVSITFDGFQSADSRQLLVKQGLPATLLSVDRNDLPYLTLRNALFERRLAYYHYQPALNELLDLTHDIDRGKVDHPDKASDDGPGRKDVADALCGSVHGALTHEACTHYAGAVVIDEGYDLPEHAKHIKDHRASQVITDGKATVDLTDPAPLNPVRVQWSDLRKNLIH